MTTTVYVTIKTKADSFDAMHSYAKEELAWTREYDGCHSIHCSSDQATNTIKFVEVWDSQEARYCQKLWMGLAQAASFLMPSTKGTPLMTSTIN